MPKLSVKFDARELKHLQDILNRGGLAVHQRPMQALFEDGSRLIYEEAKKRAPVKTGAVLNTMANVYGNTGKRPWGIGRVALGSRHGAILNNGGKGGNSVFRHGPRAGKRTRGWFSGTLRLAVVKKGIDGLARRAVDDMARRWQHG